MTIYRIRDAAPPPATSPSATVRLVDVLTVLDKHIHTFATMAGGYRTMLLLKAIRADLAALERVTE